MMFSSTVLVLGIVLALAGNVVADARYGKDQEVLRRACPDYTSYATFRQ
jgi:hypothetical protein